MEVDEQRKSSYSTEGKIKLLCLGLRVDCKGLFSMFQLRDTAIIYFVTTYFVIRFCPNTSWSCVTCVQFCQLVGFIFSSYLESDFIRSCQASYSCTCNYKTNPPRMRDKLPYIAPCRIQIEIHSISHVELHLVSCLTGTSKLVTCNLINNSLEDLSLTQPLTVALRHLYQVDVFSGLNYCSPAYITQPSVMSSLKLCSQIVKRIAPVLLV